MAIQTEMYPESSGFPMLRAPAWGSGGVTAMHDEMCSSLQRQQMLVTRQMQQFQTQKPNQINTQFFNGDLCRPELKKFDHTPVSSVSASVSQSSEIDQLIISQSERLGVVIRELRKRELSELLKKVETRTIFLLRQKDVEIAKEARRTFQLESLLMQLQNDSMTWQQIAKQNELQVTSLSNTIAQLQDSGDGDHPNNNNIVEDAESCCNEQQSCFSSELRKLCKICRTREAGVVFLPCRHLCSCTVCDTMIDFCPVCQTEKKISFEALFH